MPLRIRKLVGATLLLVLITVYSLLIMVFATSVLPSVGGALSFLFYAVAGLAWVPPAALLISWMYREPAAK